MTIIYITYKRVQATEDMSIVYVVYIYKYLNACAYYVWICWISEIFPTPARMMGLSVMRFFAMPVGSSAPVVLTWSRLNQAIVILVLNFLLLPTNYFLPETKGVPALQTLEEMDNLVKK